MDFTRIEHTQYENLLIFYRLLKTNNWFLFMFSIQACLMHTRHTHKLTRTHAPAPHTSRHTDKKLIKHQNRNNKIVMTKGNSIQNRLYTHPQHTNKNNGRITKKSKTRINYAMHGGSALRPHRPSSRHCFLCVLLVKARVRDDWRRIVCLIYRFTAPALRGHCAVLQQSTCIFYVH